MKQISRQNHRISGNAGETFACEVLEKSGYTVLCRNYKGAHGEIDIIAEKDAYLVFIEVKMRKILTQKPVSAVGTEKMLHIVNTAHEFMCEYRDNPYIAALLPRFDVFEILTADGKPAEYSHIRDVYRA